jgi:hypothetical protein
LFFTKKNKIILISIFFIVYFLIFSGFYTQLIGGSEVSLNLNNAGSNYHKFMSTMKSLWGLTGCFQIIRYQT